MENKRRLFVKRITHKPCYKPFGNGLVAFVQTILNGVLHVEMFFLPANMTEETNG